MAGMVPQELLDKIIHELGGDNDMNALHACSLTARAFLPGARAYIFQTIHFWPPIASSRVVTPKNHCQRFDKLLSQSPYLAPFVKDLRIIEGLSGPQLESETSLGRYGGMLWITASARTLITVLKKVVNLKRIAFLCKAELHWDQLTPRVLAAIEDVFRSPALESIRLLGVESAYPQKILLLLAQSGDQLKELALEMSHPRGYAGGQQLPAFAMPSTWKPRLEHWAFSEHHTDGKLVAALTPHLDLSCLKTLSLSGLWDSQIKSLLQALPNRNVVANLNIWNPWCQRFCVIVRLFLTIDIDAQNPPTSRLGLARLTNLRTFRHSGRLPVSALVTILEECGAHPGDLECIVLEALTTQCLDALGEDWIAFCAAVEDLSPNKRVELLVYANDYRTGRDAARECKHALERRASDIGLLVIQGRLSIRDKHPSSTLSTYTEPLLTN